MKKINYRFENVICDRVVDGDTIDCIIDFGFDLVKKERFRLNRINAPETRGKEKERGLISKKFLKELIEGKSVIIETQKKGKYGRYLCELYFDKVNINDFLVDQEMAEYREY